MSIFDFLKEKPMSDDELIAKFKACASTLIIRPAVFVSDFEEYQKLLEEAYRRGLDKEIEPYTLVVKDSKKMK